MAFTDTGNKNLVFANAPTMRLNKGLALGLAGLALCVGVQI
jgi:hypothetical protein